MATAANSTIINSIVGPGTLVRGDMEIDGSVRVDGVIRGTLRARGRVVVGESARLQCDIYGTSVIVGGVVKGNIFASEGVVILSSALVLGDIVTTHIRIENGTVVHGLVMASGSEEHWQERMRRWQERRSVLSRMAVSVEAGYANGQG